MPPKAKKYRPRRYAKSHKTLNKTLAQKEGLIHYYKRRAVKSTIFNLAPAGVATAFGASYDFKLTDVPGYGEFTALYDQYKIEQIEFIINPTFDDNNMSNRIDSLRPIRYVIDYDDVTVPTTENELLEYGKCKSFMCGKNKLIKVNPKILTMVYKTAVSTGYAPKGDMWLDCDDTTVPHHGIKLWFPAISPQAMASWGVEVIYHLAFKNTR